jgi:hypothetical protein
MGDSIRAVVQPLLRGVAWLMFVIAGISFWFGGRPITEFAKTDRALGEVGGIGIAVVCVGTGAMTKSAEHASERRNEGSPRKTSD